MKKQKQKDKCEQNLLQFRNFKLNVFNVVFLMANLYNYCQAKRGIHYRPFMNGTFEERLLTAGNNGFINSTQSSKQNL